MKSHAQNTPLAALALLAAAVLAGPAMAQQIYRSVGPGGSVTFSDQPPVAGSVVAGSAGGGASGPQLPFEVRQAMTRFPVTLYTSSGCAPCQSGRTLLTNRGVPFSERVVGSQEDLDALQRLSGETGVPFLTVGNQQIKGYAESDWTQYLNAAGYPRVSQLPVGYRNPPPLPMVPQAAPPAETRPNLPPPPPAATPSNPAGIKF